MGILELPCFKKKRRAQVPPFSFTILLMMAVARKSQQQVSKCPITIQRPTYLFTEHSCEAPRTAAALV